jgi:hypothetical protein
MSDFAIFLLMFSGLATIAVGLAMVWPPLAVLFGGVLLCVVAVSAYGTRHKRK